MCSFNIIYYVFSIQLWTFSLGQRNFNIPPDVPQDMIVHVINNFGVELLKKHNEFNENNLALSPYGAVSVLVALNEGTKGIAQREIQQVLHLPRDASTVRIGLRDVLRRLKTYFIPEEGFLAGLTFNNDNISLKDDYKNLLTFYGYDVESFNTPLYPSSTTSNTSTTALRTTNTSSTPTMPSSTSPATSTSNTPPPLSVPVASTTSTSPMSERTSTSTSPVPSTIISSTTVTALETEGSSTTTTSTAPTNITTITSSGVASTSSSEASSSTASAMSAETLLTSHMMSTVGTTVGSSSVATTENEVQTSDSTTEVNVTPTTSPGSESTTVRNDQETTSQQTTILDGNDQEITTQLSVTNNLPETTINEVPTTTSSTSSTVEANTETVIPSNPPENSSSSSGSTTELNSTPDSTLATTSRVDPEPSTSTPTESSTTSNEMLAKLEAIPSKSKRGLEYRKTLSKHYLPSEIHTSLFNDHQHPQTTFYDLDPSVLTFLVDGKTRESNISFMTYKAVLPYCYVPSLKSLALSFPLDSDNYYLLIILPLDDCGADFVLERIGYDTTLRDIVNMLSFTYVKATIPSFMLKGTVLLTSTLKKMGIQSVFEPGVTDFSEMTDSREIFVTNIEQMITVTIRNYIDPNKLDYFGNHYQQNPVWFKADHPFLYFVMDSHIHVSLMAGKVVNPLNSIIS